VALAADREGPALTESLARTLRATARSSDAVGRLGPREFAVLAPDTDAEGAVQLFQRIVGPLQELGASPGGTPGGDHSGIRLRAGYDARSGFHTTSLDPAVLLGRALTALRVAEQQQHAQAGTIVPFVSRPAAQ
jgi:GGDEF domain-containing protein